MTNNQTIKNRLLAFISYLGIGQGKFEKECGLANGYVNNIVKSIMPDKLQKISLRYPELNTGWLMTGDGTMLKSNEEEDLVSRLLSLLERSDQTIAEHNQRLHDEVDRIMNTMGFAQPTKKEKIA